MKITGEKEARYLGSSITYNQPHAERSTNFDLPLLTTHHRGIAWEHFRKGMEALLPPATSMISRSSVRLGLNSPTHPRDQSPQPIWAHSAFRRWPWGVVTSVMSPVPECKRRGRCGSAKGVGHRSADRQWGRGTGGTLRSRNMPR